VWITGSPASYACDREYPPQTSGFRCRSGTVTAVLRSDRISNDRRQLVQQRFPITWNSPCRSRCWLILWMRMWRKQFHTFDHPLLLVIEEPALTRFKAGYDRMPCCRRMLGCMLTRRTVTASDVPTLRTPAEMKPPTFRRRQAFYTSVATWFRSRIKSAVILLHFECSFRRCASAKSSSHQQDLPGRPFSAP
jgi:hypothetical protein